MWVKNFVAAESSCPLCVLVSSKHMEEQHSRLDYVYAGKEEMSRRSYLYFNKEN